MRRLERDASAPHHDMVWGLGHGHDYGTTIIMATHNREVLSWAPEARQVHLVRGQIVPPEPGAPA